MKNEIFFNIDSKDLILKQVLIDDNDAPLFFICVDKEKQYYVALSIDDIYQKYIIVKTKIKNIVNLLTRKITMREIILSEPTYWLVTTSESIEDDICIEYDMKSVPLAVLPYENSYFKVVTKSHENFLKKLKN